MTTAATLRDLLDHTSRDVNDLIGTITETIRRIDETATGTIAVRRYDTPGITTTPNPADLTDTARTQHADGTDRAIADRAELDQIIRQLARHADRAIRIRNAYRPRPASPLDRARADGDNRPGCASCARTHVAPGVRRWVETHRNGLCSFCYRWARKYGGLPPLPLLEKHHRGERVMVKA